MSRQQWLLVEWVEEGNVFPSYGVVNSNSLVIEDTELHNGKMIFVRSNNSNRAKQAQILRISDDKRLLKEHMAMLERQDSQVKNMVSLCMRSIKEMKSDALLGSYSNQSVNGAGSSNTALMHESSDESEQDVPKVSKNFQTNKTPIRTPAQYKFLDTEETPTANSIDIRNKRTGVGSSTPLPSSSRRPMKITFDQATQTDKVIQVSEEKFEQVETILNHLYTRFISLVDRLQINCDTDLNIESMNETAECDRLNQELSNEEPNTNTVNDEAEEDTRGKGKVQVRRVSAQTTNHIESSYMALRQEMVAIGSGNAVVPMRVMQDINWNSYTNATRQLLQAVFPRKVLATHSLTGKKSPAFLNKPPKKCLDPKLINDIVDTVAERCRVPRRSIRSCITIKCTDEAKLYRSRVLARQAKQNSTQGNQENIMPSSPEGSRDAHGNEKS